MLIKGLAKLALLSTVVSGCAQQSPPTPESPAADLVTMIEIALPAATRPAAEVLKATFDVPEHFVAGWPPESKVRDDVFGQTLVLIERKCVEANDLKPESFPTGEFPAICVSRLDDTMTNLLIQMMQDNIDYNIRIGGSGSQPIRDMTIGGHAVKRFPYYPAPYGEELYTYIVIDPGGGSLRFMASRTHQLMPDYRKPGWGERGILTATNYDVPIEAMIKTIRFASR